MTCEAWQELILDKESLDDLQRDGVAAAPVAAASNAKPGGEGACRKRKQY